MKEILLKKQMTEEDIKRIFGRKFDYTELNQKRKILNRAEKLKKGGRR